ncbi:MAG: Rrf2 family transcriptional regulator [Chlorobi bacterium]|nr:Rrf2 family transcriptional regulator [Chlorobiota bacterium]
MKLSKTSEYAIRILSYMARDTKKKYSAKNLVEKLHISDKYLRRLMTDLSKAELIYSKQGRNGGYFFAKSTDKITVAQIIDTVEGMDKYTGCIMGFDECSDENPCVMHSVWVKTRNTLLKTFETTTLAKLAKAQTIKH